MNGWPKFIVIFLQSNRYLWLRAVTFLLTTIFTDAKIQTEEVPPMNGWPGVNNLFPKPKGLTRNSRLPSPWAAIHV